MLYIAWGLILFFAGSWAFGLILRPDFRVKSTIAALIYWWIFIGLVILSDLNVYHLLWLMPLTLFTTMFVMTTNLRAGVTSIFIKSLFLVGPLVSALFYWS
jgi:hypothetical protein